MFTKIILISSLSLLISCASEKKAEEVKTEAKTEATKAVEEVKKEVKKESTGLKTLTCSSANKKDTREIEIAADGDGCRVYYTKYGVKKSVAQSKYSTSYCETVVANIQKNLTDSSYTCE